VYNTLENYKIGKKNMIKPISFVVLNRDGSFTEHSRMIVLNKINEVITVLNEMSDSEVEERIKAKLKEIKVIFQ
jgi:hypothetical protein